MLSFYTFFDFFKLQASQPASHHPTGTSLIPWNNNRNYWNWMKIKQNKKERRKMCRVFCEPSEHRIELLIISSVIHVFSTQTKEKVNNRDYQLLELKLKNKPFLYKRARYIVALSWATIQAWHDRQR